MGMRDKKAIGLPFLAERWAALAPCIAQRAASSCFHPFQAIGICPHLGRTHPSCPAQGAILPGSLAVGVIRGAMRVPRSGHWEFNRAWAP